MGNGLKLDKKVISEKTNTVGLLFNGIALLVFGLLLIFQKYELIATFSKILAVIFALSGLINLIPGIINYTKTHNGALKVLSPIFNIAMGVLLYFYPIFFINFVFKIAGAYLIIDAIIKFVTYYQMRQTKASPGFKPLFGAIFSLFVAFILIFDNLNATSAVFVFILVGLYLILFSFTYFYDFFFSLFKFKEMDNTKRKIRMMPPVLLMALMPDSFIKKFNKTLMTDDARRNDVQIEDNDKNIDMEVFVHVGKGFARFGHVDLWFEGKVYSYGDYDYESSFFGLIGDGVLEIMNDKEKYIRFCIETSNKTIIGFGISLSEEQKVKVRKQIDYILSISYPWKCNAMKGIKDLNEKDYASKNYLTNNAKFRKFEMGYRFKKYFTFGTNCVLLADTIIGASGSNILTINGFISPGTYYDYLNHEYKIKHSSIITKTVYYEEQTLKSR